MCITKLLFLREPLSKTKALVIVGIISTKDMSMAYLFYYFINRIFILLKKYFPIFFFAWFSLETFNGKCNIFFSLFI